MAENFRKWLLTSALAALAFVALTQGSGVLAPAAFAQAPPSTAQCQYFDALRPEKLRASLTDWLNGQLATGREHFLAMPNMNGTGNICAW